MNCHSTKHVFPWWGCLGLLLLLSGLWALLKDIEVWNTVWYVPAWYGYLLMLDGEIFRRSGKSFLSHRKRETGAMLFWSAPFWYLFEAYNFVLQNWYYVSGLHTNWAAFLFEWTAFATVLPACFFHARWVQTMGWFGHTRWKPLKVTCNIKRFMWVSGGCCTVFPLVFPHAAFWMVWGATLGIPEAINYRNRAPSLLRDLENGRPERLLTLLVGGAWAGLMWEGFNYWARCKWIYTVPGLEDWKLFEMPVLGFLGFPVLAVEAFAFYTFLCHYVRRGRHWEVDEAKVYAPGSPGRYTAVVTMACLFGLCVGILGLDWSLMTRRPLLIEISEFDGRSVTVLQHQGIQTPEQLVGRLSDAAPFASVLHLDLETMTRVYERSLLALHKGMGYERAKALERAGVLTISQLQGQDPHQLHLQVSRFLDKPIRLAEVKVWVRSARVHGRSHP